APLRWAGGGRVPGDRWPVGARAPRGRLLRHRPASLPRV
ncbi:MAG: hypothetical protein AVDCRST_MAG52-3211, partial [uncultured Blastococcus sp.]